MPNEEKKTASELLASAIAAVQESAEVIKIVEAQVVKLKLQQSRAQRNLYYALTMIQKESPH
jgi:hypothetical protein